MFTNPLRGIFNKAVEHLSCPRHHRSNGDTRSAPEQLNRCTQGRVPLLQPGCAAGPAVAALGNDQNRYWGHCGGSTWGSERRQEQLCPPGPSALDSAQPQPSTAGWAQEPSPGHPGASAVPIVLQGAGGCSSPRSQVAQALGPQPRDPGAGPGPPELGSVVVIVLLVRISNLEGAQAKALAPHGALGVVLPPEPGQPW